MQTAGIYSAYLLGASRVAGASMFYFGCVVGARGEFGCKEPVAYRLRARSRAGVVQLRLRIEHNANSSSRRESIRSRGIDLCSLAPVLQDLHSPGSASGSPAEAPCGKSKAAWRCSITRRINLVRFRVAHAFGPSPVCLPCDLFRPPAAISGEFVNLRNLSSEHFPSQL